MVFLEVVFSRDGNVKLFDKKTKTEHNLMFQFFGMFKLELGDIVLINENLLNKNSELFAQPYCFEISNEKSAKQVFEEKETEFIVVKKTNTNIVLKRIYG